MINYFKSDVSSTTLQNINIVINYKNDLLKEKLSLNEFQRNNCWKVSFQIGNEQDKVLKHRLQIFEKKKRIEISNILYALIYLLS